MKPSFQYQRPSWTRIAVVAFCLATIWKIWLGPAEIIPIASAQIPDSGAQRNELIKETRRTNELLSQILVTLKDGPVKVRIEGADKTPTKRGAHRQK